MSKSTSDLLLNKSLEAMTMAIEIYNKPLVKYRTETCIVLIVSAWEHLLKSIITKHSWAKLYNKKADWYKPFDECLECVKAKGISIISDEAYLSVKLLYEKRCKVIHYHKSIELLDYMVIQSNILFFKDFVSAHFNKSVIKDKTWYVLPIGTEVPFTKFDFLDHSSAIKNAPMDIRKYFQEVISIQNSSINKNSKGILISLNVSLTNVKRITDSDLKVGIDNAAPDSISLKNFSKISEQGQPVQLSIDQFNEIKRQYPLSYKDVYLGCKKKRIMKHAELQLYINKCKKNQDLAINWGSVSRSFNLPFNVGDKYMYKQKVVDDFR